MTNEEMGVTLGELARRLDTLDMLRDHLLEDRHVYLTQEVYEKQHRELVDAINTMKLEDEGASKRYRTLQLMTATLFTLTLFAITLAVAAVGLLIAHITK